MHFLCVFVLRVCEAWGGIGPDCTSRRGVSLLGTSPGWVQTRVSAPGRRDYWRKLCVKAYEIHFAQNVKKNEHNIARVGNNSGASRHLPSTFIVHEVRRTCSQWRANVVSDRPSWFDMNVATR